MDLNTILNMNNLVFKFVWNDVIDSFTNEQVMARASFEWQQQQNPLAVTETDLEPLVTKAEGIDKGTKNNIVI